MLAQELLEISNDESNSEKRKISSESVIHPNREKISYNNADENEQIKEEPFAVADTLDKVDVTCGLSWWSPNWLQQFASKKSYVAIFGLLGMSQVAIGSYFIGTISTIEKRFKMPSTTTGVITSGWDMGSLFGSMIMAYFGSAGHKTRWVAVTAIMSALSCYMRYMPQVIYGPGDNLPNYQNKSTVISTGNLCRDENVDPENCSLNSEGTVAFIVLTLAHIAIGIGTSSFHSLGIAYLDDNVLKNKFPFLLAISTCLCFFGSTLGLLIASYTLSIYIDSEATPPFDQNDPRWIGAWYLGWIPLGTLHLCLALLMALFPKILPREAKRRISSGIPLKQARKTKSIQDFKIILLRLLKNPVLVLNTSSATFYVIGMIGYWIFMPKYIETQFRQSASTASLITGSISLICTAIGVVTSGAIISRFRPRPTYLAAWNVFTETIDSIGHLAFAFLGCFKDDLSGSYNEDGSWQLTSSCNANCSCSARLSYSPVCSTDGLTTFFSPCHAGCMSYSTINGTKSYFNCSCLGKDGIATHGACPVDCSNQFIIFIGLLCFMKFLSSTGRAGNTVIQYRAVAPEDKAISIALAEVALCIFAFIPAPIAYGMLLDSSCLVWGETCGKTGNCWLYHGQSLRYLLNFTASGFLLLATLIDIGVLYKVKSLKIYDEDMIEKDKIEENDETLLPSKRNTDLVGLN